MNTQQRPARISIEDKIRLVNTFNNEEDYSLTDDE